MANTIYENSIYIGSEITRRIFQSCYNHVNNLLKIKSNSWPPAGAAPGFVLVVAMHGPWGGGGALHMFLSYNCLALYKRNLILLHIIREQGKKCHARNDYLS